MFFYKRPFFKSEKISLTRSSNTLSCRMACFSFYLFFCVKRLCCRIMQQKKLFSFYRFSQRKKGPVIKGLFALQESWFPKETNGLNKRLDDLSYLILICCKSRNRCRGFTFFLCSFHCNTQACIVNHRKIRVITAKNQNLFR